jgi:hypothetical protein
MTAAFLLTTLLVQDVPSPSDWVRSFAQGTDAEGSAARKKVLALGPRAIPLLRESRTRARRPEALDDLVFEIKTEAGGEQGRPLFDRLAQGRVTVDMQKAPSTAVVDYFREILEVNLVLDPGFRREIPEVTLLLSDVPFRRALDTLCLRGGLDYDFRCGVIFVAEPGRLWAPPRPEPPKPLSLERMKAARTLIAELGSDAPTARDRALSELRKLGTDTVPLLREAARQSDAEVAARAKELLGELAPVPPRWGAIPEAGAWRSGNLQGADLEIARKLDRMKIDLAFENSKVEDVLGFIREFSRLKIQLKSPPPGDPVTLKVRDLPMGRCLELLLLPLGLDLRIDQGAIEVLERK